MLEETDEKSEALEFGNYFGLTEDERGVAKILKMSEISL